MKNNCKKNISRLQRYAFWLCSALILLLFHILHRQERNLLRLRRRRRQLRLVAREATTLCHHTRIARLQNPFAPQQSGETRAHRTIRHQAVDGRVRDIQTHQERMQEPVNLTVPSVRTMQDLAEVLGNKLMLDSATIAQALSNEDTCHAYGYDTTTIAALFVPNTYDIYWNISLSGLLRRMQKENKHF